MKVFYNKEQQVDGMRSESPSAGKPRLVLNSWNKITTVEKMSVTPLSDQDISLAHDPSYVKGILLGKTKNGFGNKDRRVAKSLRWTTGSFVTAAIHAWSENENTFSPTSGFHHAKYSCADGFCTFNALTIAAIKLRSMGAQRIGILDLDSHIGDGTDQTLRKQGADEIVAHYSLGYDNVDLYNNQLWIDKLPGMLREMFSNCEVILYQAGVDCHIDDPFVDRGEFTTEQIYERDLAVFCTFKELEIPVVSNLAGGYQTPVSKVIGLHDLLAKAYLESCR